MFYEYVKLLSHRAHMHTWFWFCLEAERRARVLRTNVPFVDCSEEVNVIVWLLLEYRIYCTPKSSLHRESTDCLIICYKLNHNLPTLPTYLLTSISQISWSGWLEALSLLSFGLLVLVGVGEGETDLVETLDLDADDKASSCGGLWVMGFRAISSVPFTVPASSSTSTFTTTVCSGCR